MNLRLWLLCLILLATACAPPMSEKRTLEVYMAVAGPPGVELPGLLPIRHPLLLRQMLAGADSFRQELGTWLRHPRLMLVESRHLELPRRHERIRVVGQAGGANWILEVRRQGGRPQVQLTIRERGRGETSSGWSDVSEAEDLVLGMPLADGAGLLLRLPPPGVAPSSTEALPESLRGQPVFRELAQPPIMLDGGPDLARIFAYPARASQDGIQGTVRLMIHVDEDGKVQGVELLSGVRPDLDSAAVAGARTLRFAAGRDDRGPVSTWVTLPVRYHLQEGAAKP
jgi:TonB family protein